MGFLVLFLILVEMLWVFPLFSMMMASDWLYIALMKLRCVHPAPISLDSPGPWSYKDLGFCQSLFASNEMVMWFLSLSGYNLCFSDVILNWVFKYFIENICIYFLSGNWQQFYFLLLLNIFLVYVLG